MIKERFCGFVGDTDNSSINFIEPLWEQLLSRLILVQKVIQISVRRAPRAVRRPVFFSPEHFLRTVSPTLMIFGMWMG